MHRYRQHCAQRNAPVFKLLRGRFFTDGVKFGIEEGTEGPLSIPFSTPNFTPIGATIRDSAW